MNSSDDQPDRDRRFMQLALDICRQGIEQQQTPFGACIVRDNHILATAHNGVRLHNDPTAHAEILCIRQACRNLNDIDLAGCTIYSTTEPCPMCFSAIHWARIGRIVFAARIDDAQSFGFNELQLPNAQLKSLANLPVTLTPDFMREQALALYQLWHQNDGQPY